MKNAFSIQALLKNLLEAGTLSTPVANEAYPLGVGAVMPGDLPADWMGAVESYQAFQQ